MMRRQQSSSVLFVVAIALCCALAATEAKSIKKASPQLIDPLTAVPSEQEQHYQVVEQPKTEIRYVYESQAPATSEPAHENQSAPQVAIEYQPQPAPQHQQLVEQPHQPAYQRVMRLVESAAGCSGNNDMDSVVVVDENARARHQAVDASTLTAQEYPGRTIYVNQNGELISPLEGQLTVQQPAQQAHQPQQSPEQQQAPTGVAATILTEVPLKEMPHEVLERLKQEYGVKVVATRDYPGANLVINCDANQDNAMCNRYPTSISMTPIGHRPDLSRQRVVGSHYVQQYHSPTAGAQISQPVYQPMANPHEQLMRVQNSPQVPAELLATTMPNSGETTTPNVITYYHTEAEHNPQTDDHPNRPLETTTPTHEYVSHTTSDGQQELTRVQHETHIHQQDSQNGPQLVEHNAHQAGVQVAEQTPDKRPDGTETTKDDSDAQSGFDYQARGIHTAEPVVREDQTSGTTVYYSNNSS